MRVNGISPAVNIHAVKQLNMESSKAPSFNGRGKLPTTFSQFKRIVNDYAEYQFASQQTLDAVRAINIIENYAKTKPIPFSVKRLKGDNIAFLYSNRDHFNIIPESNKTRVFRTDMTLGDRTAYVCNKYRGAVHTDNERKLFERLAIEVADRIERGVTKSV